MNSLRENTAADAITAVTPVTAVKRDELMQQSSDVVQNHQILGPELAADQTVLHGHISFKRLRSGLVLHAADVQDLHPMTTQAELDEGLTLALVLDGRADIRYGQRQFAFGPKPGKNGRLQREAALIAVAEPDLFERRSQQGGFERTVTIGISPEWLEESGMSGHGALSSFSKIHLNARFWQASPRMLRMAEQILAKSVMDPVLHHIYLESRSLDMLSEAFSGLSAASDMATAPRKLLPREQQRTVRLRDFLDSGEADHLSLEEIAREIGVNANTLQKQFKTMYGSSIFEHLKERRMQEARSALEVHGISVSAAALLAGYQSAANFSTGFKARFGCSPRDLKKLASRSRTS